MKYIQRTVLVMFSLAFFLMVAPAQAQTIETTSALTSQLEALLKQVSDLQAQMEQLNARRAELTKEIVATRIALTKRLREGATDEEVKVLQELLALDPVVYPEGLVTGYYGPLTTKAVRKFQEKYGIETVGEVGPKTLAKLNEVVSHGAWKEGDLPPGIAKRFSSSTIESLPPGIYKKFIEQFWSNKGDDDDEEDSDDSDSDTLTIEDIEADDAGATVVRIKWHTDIKSRGTVYLSTGSPVSVSASSTVTKGSSLRKSHDVRFFDLEDDGVYYFVIVAAAGDEEVTSEEYKFVLDGEDEKYDDEEDTDEGDEEDDEDEDDDNDEDEDD